MTSARTEWHRSVPAHPYPVNINKSEFLIQTALFLAPNGRTAPPFGLESSPAVSLSPIWNQAEMNLVGNSKLQASWRWVDPFIWRPSGQWLSSSVFGHKQSFHHCTVQARCLACVKKVQCGIFDGLNLARGLSILNPCRAWLYLLWKTFKCRLSQAKPGQLHMSHGSPSSV